MKKLFFVVTLAVFAASTAITLAYAVEDAEAMGRKLSTSTTTYIGQSLPSMKEGTVMNEVDKRFYLIDSTDEASPFVAILAEGVFKSKQEFDTLTKNAMGVVSRTFGAKWKEIRSVVGIHDERLATQANNGKPLNNVKIYYFERRIPKGGLIVGEVFNKPRANNNNNITQPVKNGNGAPQKNGQYRQRPIATR